MPHICKFIPKRILQNRPQNHYWLDLAINHCIYIANLTTDTSNTAKTSTSGRGKRKSSAKSKVCSNESEIEIQFVCDEVKREENSIKRVMAFVDKRMVNRRTSYFCKWPDCGYVSLRSDSLVRHIRSHTGERPYRCSIANCNYATIQQSTLNKHLGRHLTNIFSV